MDTENGYMHKADNLAILVQIQESPPQQKHGGLSKMKYRPRLSTIQVADTIDGYMDKTVPSLEWSWFKPTIRQ